MSNCTGEKLFDSNAKTLIFNTIKNDETNSNIFIKTSFTNLVLNVLKELHKQNIQSVIIEGGATTLQSFIKAKLWDEARIFTANKTLVEGVKAPTIEGVIISEEYIGGDQLKLMSNV